MLSEHINGNKNKDVKARIANKKLKIKKLLMILLVLLCVITVTPVLARYVYDTVNNFFYRTNEFYFNSDKLAPGSGTYFQVDNWDGSTPYPINVKMNSRLNNIKKVNYDINYTISVSYSTNCTCSSNKVSSTIPHSSNEDTFRVTINPQSGLVEGDVVTCTITVTSGTGYNSILCGTFALVVGRDEISYEITDSASSVYCNVSITNSRSYYLVQQDFGNHIAGDRLNSNQYLALSAADKAKCCSARITLTFSPNNVLLDMTNENYLNAIATTTSVIGGKTYITSITFEMEPASSTIIRFYKTDISQNYTYSSASGGPTPVVGLTNHALIGA